MSASTDPSHPWKSLVRARAPVSELVAALGLAL